MALFYYSGFVSQQCCVKVDCVDSFVIVMQLLLLSCHRFPVKLLAEEEVGDLEAGVGVGVGAGGCHLAARVQGAKNTGSRTPWATMTASRALQGFLEAFLLL